MTMIAHDYADELNDCERDDLHKAAGRLDDFGSSLTPPSALRYGFYRRRGYSRADSFRYALAWCKNSNDQYERRLGHDTGAEGWRKIEA